MANDAVLTSDTVKMTPFRQRVVTAWRGLKSSRDGKDPIIRQKTYRSTLPVTFTVADANPALAPAGFALATLAPTPDNALAFFSYGISDQIPDGFGGQIKATATDTNQSKGKQTNGGEVVGIEGVSFGCVGMRLQYDPAIVGAIPVGAITPVLRKTLLGGAVLRDPASVMSPPQFDSPANLENPWLDTWASSTTFTPQFDTTNQQPLGALDEAGEGGARSFLKSHGDPNTANKFRMPDGLLWMPDGEEGSNLIFVAQPTHALSMVLTGAVTLPGATVANPVFPVQIVMDVVMRLSCFVCAGVNPNQT